MNTGLFRGRRMRNSKVEGARRRRLRLEALEDRRLLAPLADIVNVTPDPRVDPVGQVVINFTDSVTGLPTGVTGVDVSDFSLKRNNVAVSLAGVPVSGSGDTWAIDLAGVAIDDGFYVLTLNAAGSGIADSNLDPLASDAIDSWTIDTFGPSADIVNITPDPRTTVVGSVAINFTDPVIGVDINDFRLTRNGTPVSLAGLVVNGGGGAYTIDLSSVTLGDGTYVFTLVAAGSGIADSLGNLLDTDASDTWLTDSTPPTANIDDVTPDPRNTGVPSITVTFNRAVTGVDTADFSLTRNGTNVALTGVTVSGTGSTYTLNNLTTATSPVGTYVLTLNAANSGIVDSNGLALAASATDTWVVETTVPTVDIIDVTPDPRMTPVSDVKIDFSEPVTGVDIGDFTLTRNGTAISLVGLPLTIDGDDNTIYHLNLSTVTTSVGSYTLTIVTDDIADLAGNKLAKGASDSFSIDDMVENNDTLGSATELGRLRGPVSYGPLSLIDLNDWYRFTMNSKGGAADRVTITFQNGEGDLDLQLYSVSGRLLKSSTGTGNSETISLSGRPSGTYYIRVFGKAGAINPEYFLTINVPRVPVEDTFEQNDTRATASNLGTFVSAATISNLALLDSHDWYRFTTTATGTADNDIAINFRNAQGNLNLELYNAGGARIGSSNTAGNSELISLAGRAAGTYYVHVLGRNGARNVNYSLTINPPSTSAFSFQFAFDGMNAAQVATFQQAASRWQSIITSDLPSAVYTPSIGASTLVDDLLIDVATFPIDSKGNILGGSAPDAFRSGSFLPYHGLIVFDTADLASLQAEGTLFSAALHEMAHVLGFGTIWTDKGLLTGAGTNDPKFTGTQALAAYNTVFGGAATSVPVDDTEIEGTADSHWRESVLGNELMTGFLGPGTTNPLSVITLASMADLGYSVNLALADPYSKPAPLMAVQAPSSSSSIHLTNAAELDALLTNWRSMKNDVKKWTLFG